MCGCGLDMVPVPGSILVEDIEAIIIDVATLSVRLKKPLGIRMLPIPERTLNEMTEFNMDFLCDARVFNVDGSHKSIKLTETDWSFSTPHFLGVNND